MEVEPFLHMVNEDLWYCVIGRRKTSNVKFESRLGTDLQITFALLLTICGMFPQPLLNEDVVGSKCRIFGAKFGVYVFTNKVTQSKMFFFCLTITKQFHTEQKAN